jgi:protease PrsW
MSYLTNSWTMELFDLDRNQLARFGAPVVEEIIKGVLIVVVLVRNRVGFVVDAAITGFAVGTGFAIVENLFYLYNVDNPNLVVWIVRGFGTAIMHGGAVAMMAIIAKMGFDRWKGIGPRNLSVKLGLLVAIGIHMAYNNLILPPVQSSLVVFVTIPVIILGAFAYSERQTRKWLGDGLDKDAEILELLMKGDLPSSRIGEYLTSLREHFEGPVMADLINYLRLHLELSAQAKGVLMMKEYGITPQPDPYIDAYFEELEYLKKSIGKTGVLALHPLLDMSDRDLWQLRMLRE